MLARGTVFGTVLTLSQGSISLVGGTKLSETGTKFSKTEVIRDPVLGTSSIYRSIRKLGTFRHCLALVTHGLGPVHVSQDMSLVPYPGYTCPLSLCVRCTLTTHSVPCRDYGARFAVRACSSGSVCTSPRTSIIQSFVHNSVKCP